MRPHHKPTCYIGDPHLGQKLFHQVQHGPLYDEVGDARTAFGWVGLLKHGGIFYIIYYTGDVLAYKCYPKYKSALKAWDYVCIKHEKWYTSQ